ncbi:uncharacterized protein LOC134241237 [Saccostrea cucullata]|uniref:uncharacterized protein LOC134241237 n=1 Tax=Saccostrea cuccullata TaxID=36930 RepID=UPI002ED154BA
MNSNNNAKFTTVGQKLLKEPIWIGMIVVFILLIIFGISYIIKKKCAKYLICCKDTKDILREREDEIPAHCNNPLSSSPPLSLQASVVIKENIDCISTDNLALDISDYAPESSTTTPRNLTPKVDITNKKAAAKLFASYDKHLSFPFDAHNLPSGMHPVGGLKSGVLEFNPSEKEDNGDENFVLQSPPLPSEYRKLRYSQTTSVFDTKSGRQAEDSSNHVTRSKSLSPAILQERHQYPRIVIINENVQGSGGFHEQDHGLAVSDQEKQRRSSFTEMKAEDKRRIFSNSKTSFQDLERSVVPSKNVRRSNSNREVLILSQSDNNYSSDAFVNSLDIDIVHSQPTTGLSRMERKLSLSDTKVCGRAYQSNDHPSNLKTSASVNENRRNKSICSRKYHIRIVKRSNRSRQNGRSRSRDTSCECSCASREELNTSISGKKRHKKRSKKRVEVTDSSSDREDFYQHPFRKSKRNDLPFPSPNLGSTVGQTQASVGKDNEALSYMQSSFQSHLRKPDDFLDIKQTEILRQNNKNFSLSSSNPSENDDPFIIGRHSIHPTDTDTGFSSSSKSLYTSPWRDGGIVSRNTGSEHVRTRSIDINFTKERLRSTNSVNGSRVKDSAYESKQSSLDTMSFERTSEKRYENWINRYEDRKITKQLEQVSFKLSLLRNKRNYSRDQSKDSAFVTVSDEDPCIWDSDSSGRRSSYPGIINKAFTLEQVSEEGDVANTPDQTAAAEHLNTKCAIISTARQNPVTSTIEEDIEMVEFIV